MTTNNCPLHTSRASSVRSAAVLHCFCGIWVLWPELWCAEHVQPEPIRLGQQRQWGEEWRTGRGHAWGQTPNVRVLHMNMVTPDTREVVGNRNLVGQPRTIRVNWNVIVLKQGGRDGRLLLFSFIAGLRPQLHLFHTFNCNCRSLKNKNYWNLTILLFFTLHGSI